MVAEEVADMVADIVVGMEVDGMVVDMMDIIKKLPFFPWLVVADTHVDGDKTDEVKVTEESIKGKNKNFVG